MPDPSLDRYVRQIRYTPLGEAGQRKLMQSGVLIVGCGALGSALANTMVRAGTGRVRIVDRDFVDVSNLQRQSLFDEQDAAAGIPKAVAAAEKLRRINSQVEIEPVVAHVGPANLAALCDRVDLILDGTDNFETRYLLNDFSLKQRVPWIYGGCVGAEGQSMTILPGETACLRCLLPDCPAPGTTATCDTAGILGPIVSVIAAIEAAEAIKILSGNAAEASRRLTIVDLWGATFHQVDLGQLRQRACCPACGGGEYQWLDGKASTQSAVLCGRNAVQLTPPDRRLALAALAQQWNGLGEVVHNPFLARLKAPPYELTVFPDGRAIIGGTNDPDVAWTVYSRYVGN